MRLDRNLSSRWRLHHSQLRTTHRKQAELEKRTAYSAAQSATHSRPEASLKSTLSVGGGADSTSASVLSPSRKLLPGQGAEVTHTRVFATGSVVVGSPALEYAHMGMLAEVRRGKFMVAWQASPDIEGGEEQARGHGRGMCIQLSSSTVIKHLVTFKFLATITP